MESNAQVSGLTLGYCDGQINTSGTISSSTKNIWVHGAIYIPSNILNTYSGNKIDSIRAGLASKLNIDTLTVWIRSSLDGENLVEGTITSSTDQKIVKGWNQIKLDESYSIQENNTEGIYIGYSFHQKSASFGLSVISTPTENGLFVKIGNEEWENRSSEGTLCIEALVYGESLPKVNLTFGSMTVQNVFVLDKGTFNVEGTVKNNATLTVTGYDVQAKFEGIDDVYTQHVDANIAYKESGNFNVTFSPTITEIGTGSGNVTITVMNINEGEDEDMTDNSLSGTFSIVSHDFTRNILMEEFTTEYCSNCPRMAGYISDALEKDEYKDRVFTVCHHSGYYTDWLTADCDASYLWLFNSRGTYAPAIMTDRYSFGGSTPVFCPSSQNEMESYWNSRLEEPAFVSLSISATADGDNDNSLHVTVTGSKSVDKLCDNPLITVFVVEDNIEARSQAGASDFIHNHVTRTYNSIWGDPITWNGNDYEYTCDLTLSSSWVKENLHIVAFIANYNSEDATDCEVQNTYGIPFSKVVTSSISGVKTENTETKEYYTLSGMKVPESKLAKGIYIEKTGGKTKKVLISE